MLSAQGPLFGAAFAFLERAARRWDSAFHDFGLRRSRCRRLQAGANASFDVECSLKISLDSTFSTCAENVEINEQPKLSGNRKIQTAAWPSAVHQIKVVQRLQDRAIARAVWAKQQRDGPKVDLLPGTDTLEVFNFNPADAHSGTSEFAAEGAI